MPDLTVIDGGYDPLHSERLLAQRHFEAFAISLLRSLASGQVSHEVVRQLVFFAGRVSERELPIASVIDAAVSNLHSEAFEQKKVGEIDREMRRISQASLRVVAESMARDTAAKARISRRMEELQSAIEAHVLADEERARSRGWSYLRKLAETVRPSKKGKPLKL